MHLWAVGPVGRGSVPGHPHGGCGDGDGGALLLGGGYDFRVGQLAYVRGPGYMGSGPVTEIERGAEQ